MDILCFYDIVSTELGDIGIVWRKNKTNISSILRIFLPHYKAKLLKEITALFPLIAKKKCTQLQRDIVRFTSGEIATFDHVIIETHCLNQFQKKLYTYQRSIPRGSVISYGMLGAAVGYHNAGRAVGNAQAVNPFPLIVPCHKVLRSNGEVGGFQGGADMKMRLLALEGITGITKNGKYYIDEKYMIR